MDVRSVLEKQIEFTGARILASLEDLSPEEMTARPQGLASILWQVGHIAYYDHLVARRVGDADQIPPAYDALFKYGSADEGKLPPSDEIIRFFRQGQEVLLGYARGDLDRPYASGTETQPVGGALIRMLYHRGYHHGKIMTLRALLQKPRLLG